MLRRLRAISQSDTAFSELGMSSLANDSRRDCILCWLMGSVCEGGPG
jgi:hypothetical protein